MSFWTGEKLIKELQEQKLVTDFDEKRIDCASYRLRLGNQAFVTSDEFYRGGPYSPITKELGDVDAFLKVPPGQFAFLLTQEVVRVPKTAIAFISIRARYKFKGLLNVSGFHVDPGWEGKLIFGVYNAGASDLIFKRGEELFLIVYADLSSETRLSYEGDGAGRTNIASELIQGMTGQVFSPLLLQRKMEDVSVAVDRLKNKNIESMYEIKKYMDDNGTRIDKFEHRQSTYWTVATAIFGILVTAAFYFSTSEFGKRAIGNYIETFVSAANLDENHAKSTDISKPHP